MTLKADPAQIHYLHLQQINHPLTQPRVSIMTLQRRVLSAIVITLLLLILTYTLDVLSVWAEIATSTALPTLGLLNLVSTIVTLLTPVAGIGAAVTFVSYRAKVLHCGNPSPQTRRPQAPSSFHVG